jgi:hypothetical protein
MPGWAGRTRSSPLRVVMVMLAMETFFGKRKDTPL